MKKLVVYLLLLFSFNFSVGQESSDEESLKVLVQNAFDNVFSDL